MRKQLAKSRMYLEHSIGPTTLFLQQVNVIGGVGGPEPRWERELS